MYVAVEGPKPYFMFVTTSLMDRSILKRPAKSVDKTTKRLVTSGKSPPLQRTSSALTVLSPASDSASEGKEGKDDDSQATLVADEPSVVRHEVIVHNLRAKNNVSNGQTIFTEEILHRIAKQAESAFRQDLKNRCYTYRMPMYH